MTGAISAGRQRAAAHGTSCGSAHARVEVVRSCASRVAARASVLDHTNAAPLLSNQMLEKRRGQRAQSNQMIGLWHGSSAGDEGALPSRGGDILQNAGGAERGVSRFLTRGVPAVW
jgi:hypothetical protein